MMKSQASIERDFYKYVCSSTLGKSIRGTVFRPRMRPDNSTNEDIVVEFLSGKDEQIQDGVVIVNVYVPDVSNKGRLVPDDPRIYTLEEMIPNLISTCKGVDYFVKTDETSKVHAIDEIHQHCIAIRLYFKCLTD